MPDDYVQIFMSYARADDKLPPDPAPKAKGFVTALFEELNYELGNRGKAARIWRDIRRIERGDQFDQMIKDAVASSGILVVILSENWMVSEYCKKELECFKEKWRHEGEEKLRSRIVVIGKHHVDRSRRPSLLQGQEGFDFYVSNDPDEVSAPHEFFKRGEINDPRYYSRVEELGVFLARRAKFILGKSVDPLPKPPPKNWKIYVAIPAGDMREAYGTVTTELERRGYTVVPDPMKNFPFDSTAGRIMDDAFKDADASVHLLGEGLGGTPEGEKEPIARLQLIRAAAKVTSAGNGKPSVGGFRRFIWAPKELDKDRSNREPLEVLKRFHPQADTDGTSGGGIGAKLVAGDLVDGDILGEFVASVIRGIENPIQAPEPKGDGSVIPPNSQVYIYHCDEDRAYALSIAKALRECKIIPIMPAVGGDPVKVEMLHRHYLRDNDFVVLCWANATNLWMKTTSHELKHWEQLGRTKQFSCRGLVVGPPPDCFKSELEIVPPPPSEIDIVLDLTKKDPPSPEAMVSLVPVRPQHS